MRTLYVILTLCLIISCKAGEKNEQNKNDSVIKSEIVTPIFSADSAYTFVEKQVSFGPRVPNSKGHIACGNYLEEKLREFGSQVTIQNADLKAFDGTILKSKNIIGSYNLEAQFRILLFAHWDTRPWADNDPDKKNHKTPILGANDGASGVGVLLEIARHLGKNNPKVGIDIAFFDAEDYGAVSGDESSWCLGTQYWAKNPHVQGYRANYGILLDMVGAPGAKFYREQISDYYAKHIVDKVWAQAAALGFGNYFINEPGGAITDDHLYVNQMAGIPSIDIIHHDKSTPTGFGSYWHTMDDTMKNIDRNTLQAVGTTVMNVVYSE